MRKVGKQTIKASILGAFQVGQGPIPLPIVSNSQGIKFPISKSIKLDTQILPNPLPVVTVLPKNKYLNEKGKEVAHGKDALSYKEPKPFEAWDMILTPQQKYTGIHGLR